MVTDCGSIAPPRRCGECRSPVLSAGAQLCGTCGADVDAPGPAWRDEPLVQRVLRALGLRRP
jgi:hypothetical protein